MAIPPVSLPCILECGCKVSLSTLELCPKHAIILAESDSLDCCLQPVLRRASGWIRDLTAEGIEPNPGPLLIEDLSSARSGAKRSKQRNGKSQRTNTKIVIAAPASRRKRRTQKVGGGGMYDGGLSGAPAYLGYLADPWGHGPERIGCGTYQPTDVASAYGRKHLAAQSIWVIATDFTNSSNFLRTYNPANTSVATLSSSATSDPPTNQAVVGAMIANLYRVTSGGLRGVVPYASSTVAPYVYSGVFYSSQTALESMTVDLLTGLPQMHLIAPSVAGAIQFEVPFLPGDLTDYQFVTGGTAAYGAATVRPWGVVVVAGTTSPYPTPYVEIISHIEGSSSIAASSDAVIPTFGYTLDDAFRAVTMIHSSLRQYQRSTGMNAYRNVANLAGEVGRGFSRPVRALRR